MQTFIIFLLFFLQSDTTDLNVPIQVFSDTVNVEVVAPESWWAKNEGAFISTLGGVFIAVLAAFLTYLLSKRQTQEREEKIYQGILYSVHIELDWQQNHNNLLRRELSNLHRLSHEEGRFIVERAPDEFHTNYIESSRERILNYNSFNHKILAFLSTYINLLIDANRHIDFSIARSLDLGDDLNHRRELISQYFQKIEENCLSKIDRIIPNIRALIEEELIDYPTGLINTETDKIKKEINNLLSNWEEGELDEYGLLDESEKLFKRTFKGIEFSKSDYRSIVTEVLSHLEILNHQLIIKEDIPTIRKFLNTNKGNEIEAWKVWEKYWNEIDFDNRKEQLLENEFYSTTQENT